MKRDQQDTPRTARENDSFTTGTDQTTSDQIPPSIAQQIQHLNWTLKQLQDQLAQKDQSERALQQDLEKYRLIVESAVYPIILADQHGNYIFVNTAAAENFSTTPEQLIGKSPFDLFPDNIAQNQVNAAKRVIGTNTPEIVENYLTIQDKQRWYRTYIQPVTINPSSEKLVLILSTDISDRKLIEIDLKESEKKYRTLVEGAGEPIFSVDYYGKFHFLNTLAARQMGGTPDQFVGKTMWDLFPLEHANRQVESIKRVIDSNISETIEKPTMVKGKVRWYRTNIQPLTVSSPPHKLVLVISHDITARKQAEESLKLSEQRYKLLIGHLGASVAVFDNTGKLLLLNEKAATNIGLTKKGLVGKKIFEIFDSSFAKIASERIQKTIKTGRSYEYEDNINTKIGPKYFLNLYTPLKDQHENITSVQVVSHDITERKAIEKALKESEERYKFLSDVTSEGILIHENNRFIDSNNALLNIFGYSETEFKSFNLSKIILPEYRDVLNQNIAKGVEEPYEVVGKTKDGRRINLLIHAKNMLINGTQCRVASIRDVTKERSMTKELESYKEKLLQTFRHAYINYTGAIVAHQLNQPLTVINMLLGQIKNNISDNNLDTKAIFKQIDQCISESNNAALIMSKFRNSVRNPTWDTAQYIDPGAIAKKIISTLRYRAELKKLNIVDRNIQGLNKIYFNENALEQIFYILMQNSIEAANGTDKKTLIVIGENITDGIRLKFMDNCGGIDQENASRIFEPFFTTKENKHGMGLGLEIIHRILITCEGKLELNNSPGQGAEFVVTLPVKFDSEG